MDGSPGRVPARILEKTWCLYPGKQQIVLACARSEHPTSLLPGIECISKNDLSIPPSHVSRFPMGRHSRRSVGCARWLGCGASSRRFQVFQERRDDLQCLQAAQSLRSRFSLYVHLEVALRLKDNLGKQEEKLLGTLDALETRPRDSWETP